MPIPEATIFPRTIAMHFPSYFRSILMALCEGSSLISFCASKPEHFRKISCCSENLAREATFKYALDWNAPHGKKGVPLYVLHRPHDWAAHHQFPDPAPVQP